MLGCQGPLLQRITHKLLRPGIPAPSGVVNEVPSGLWKQHYYVIGSCIVEIARILDEIFIHELGTLYAVMKDNMNFAALGLDIIDYFEAGIWVVNIAVVVKAEVLKDREVHEFVLGEVA